ncbi:Ig-like domain-containing protein [Candidatus Palauibacter sp.]|uniref:Ig-like domain-containing protein n=1 Tax=Candidatus Palauibacter sp. TaxID=3101350 RepID=UPI003B01D37B
MNERTTIRINGLRDRDLFRSLLLVAALFGIASCGGDGTTEPPPPPPPPPPAAPVAVGSIPAQVMTAGQSVTVDVTPFFSDPDGGTLTYTAASSDDGVVSVSLSGGSLTVTAVAAGTATVTVTATDPDGLTAMQSANITVEAANRAPEAVGAIPAQTMTAGQSATVDVSAFFSDPDGDELTYAAESSDAAVATASVEGGSLTVTAVAAGTATVTVTAADPDGLTATQGAEVTVEASSAGFRDDFESAASLDDWEIVEGRASVSDGLLRLTNTDDEPGWMRNFFDFSLTSWTLRARMSRAEGRGRVSLAWYTGNERYTTFSFDIKRNSSGNYALYMWDDEEEDWIKLDDQSGESDAVNDGAGEMTEITIIREEGELIGLAGDTELFRWRLNKTAAPLFDELTGVELHYDSSSGDRSGLYDWVEATGIETGGAMADPPVARSVPESARSARKRR